MRIPMLSDGMKVWMGRGRGGWNVISTLFVPILAKTLQNEKALSGLRPLSA